MSLNKELNDVDNAIKELMEEKDGELNITYINKDKIKKERKVKEGETLRDKLKRKSWWKK